MHVSQVGVIWDQKRHLMPLEGACLYVHAEYKLHRELTTINRNCWVAMFPTNFWLIITHLVIPGNISLITYHYNFHFKRRKFVSQSSCVKTISPVVIAINR